MKKYSRYLIAALCLTIALVSICFIPISASKLIPAIEQQVSEDLGVKIHIDKLILRIGPSLKVKTPIMHLMYNDGQKFAQLDNVKFYIPWFSLIKNNPSVNKLYAGKLILKIKSDDKCLPAFLDSLRNKDFEEIPNICLKNYSLLFANKKNNDTYMLEGQGLELSKLTNYKNFKISTTGSLSINDKKYINYDLSVLPKIPLVKQEYDTAGRDLTEFFSQIKELDFHSDIMADLKLYKNTLDTIQASGLINVDNISVLDYAGKSQKSFIYLTLFGDKASITSNIYTSPGRKIYIDGKVTNSKKPVVDLKVKTDEINLSDLYKKIKILADFSGLRSINSAEGTLNANFTLKGDVNKIKSSGYMKVSNASIKADGLQIERINSDIDFSNNAVNITNAVGYINNAPVVASGRIDKTIDVELLMNEVELKYLCPSSFGIQSGEASLAANVSGTLNNITHKENLQIEKLKIVKDDTILSVENLKLDTNKNNTAYINNITLQNPETEIITIPQLKLLIENDGIKIPETNIFLPNSKLSARSEISNLNNNDISFNTVVTGLVNSRDIIKLKEYPAVYPLKININGNRNTQNINAQVLLEKPVVLDEPAIINLSSKLDKNSFKIDDLSIMSQSGKFSDDFKSNLKGQKKAVITGVIEYFSEPSFKNIRIFIPQILNINIFDTLAQLKGDLFINGKLDKPEIVGQLNITNLFNQALQLGVSNCNLDFNKNNIVINAPLVKLADSSMSINASASTDFADAVTIKNVNVKSKYLNTDTILMYKDSPIMKLYPFVIKDGKFYSEKILADVYGSPLYLTAFSADLRFQDEILFLKNISSEIFNGKLAGSLNYNMRDENFDSKIMARGVSASPIVGVISPRKDDISGTMDFDMSIKGELTSKQSLNGDIKFVVHNGRMSTLGKLEHLLYAQNVVADNMLRTSLGMVTKAITLKDTGLFKYLRGDIQLVNGIANIKMIQSQGPLMSLYIKGLYNPMTDYAKMVILGRLSDEVVSGLGVFGEFSFNKLMVMLTGEDSKYNLVYEDFEKLPQLSAKNTKEFRSVINGTLDKPKSVISFNWISYSEKSLRQKDVPMTNIKVPAFVDELPY